MLIKYFDKSGKLVSRVISSHDYRPKKGAKKTFENKTYEVIHFDYKSNDKYVEYQEI